MHLLFRTCNILFVLGNLMGSGIIAQDILSDGFREPLSNVQQEIASLYPSRVKDPISRKNLYRSGHYNV
ncbi:MAG: hypothetical protein ACKOZY_10850, partial [Flavobacteriales bacterium]